MNVHVPQEVRERFPDWDFRGKRFKRFGRTWIRAKSRTFYATWYYCFEEDEIFCQAYETPPWVKAKLAEAAYSKYAALGGSNPLGGTTLC